MMNPRTMQRIERDGWAIVYMKDAAAQARAAPWEFAERLLGVRPVMVERQPIQAVSGGRSFASTSGPTPLHTDSQRYDGRPARYQVMACERPASRGGETLLVDTHRFVAKLDADEQRELRAVSRRIRFYFGVIEGPTLSDWFTHSPIPDDADPIGQRIRAALAAERPIVVRPKAHEVLVVDNHRMLHGRTAFADVRRSFTRLLVWPGPPTDVSEHRLGVVLEMLRGVPPGVLSQREGVDEATLYRWRDEALRAARSILKQEVT